MSGPRITPCAGHHCDRLIVHRRGFKQTGTLWRHSAGGMCDRCWSREYRSITPAGYRLIITPWELIADDWVMLRDDGCSVRDATPRLGVTVAALDQALTRAKRRGDPRGSRQPFARDMRGAA